MAEELCAGRDCDKVRFLKLVKFWLKALSILFESSQVLAVLAGIVRILQNKVIFFAEHCAGRDCYCKIFETSQVLLMSTGIVTSKFFETSQGLAEEHCAGRDSNPCTQHQTQSNMQ